MRVACLQLDVAWQDKPANLARARRLLEGLDLPPGSLVVLPEMFAVGFSMNVAAICEGADRPAERFLADLAARRGVYVVGGVVTAGADGRGRNEAVCFAPGGRQIGRYCKLHPFRFAGEADFYAPGEDVVVVDAGPLRLAPLICYDLRFPEAFRRAVRRGADLFVVIANWPRARVDHWTTLLRARAVENQAFVVGANRCGADPNVDYPGRSIVVDPLGAVLAEAGEDEGAIAADLDPGLLRDWRERFGALGDIRDDLVPP